MPTERPRDNFPKRCKLRPESNLLGFLTPFATPRHSKKPDRQGAQCSWLAVAEPQDDEVLSGEGGDRCPARGNRYLSTQGGSGTRRQLAGPALAWAVAPSERGGGESPGQKLLARSDSVCLTAAERGHKPSCRGSTLDQRMLTLVKRAFMDRRERGSAIQHEHGRYESMPMERRTMYQSCLKNPPRPSSSAAATATASAASMADGCGGATATPADAQPSCAAPSAPSSTPPPQRPNSSLRRSRNFAKGWPNSGHRHGSSEAASGGAAAIVTNETLIEDKNPEVIGSIGEGEELPAAAVAEHAPVTQLAQPQRKAAEERPQANPIVEQIHNHLQRDAEHFAMIYAAHPEVDEVDLPRPRTVITPPCTYWSTSSRPSSRSETPVYEPDAPPPPPLPRPPQGSVSMAARYNATIRGTLALEPLYRSSSSTPTPGWIGAEGNRVSPETASCDEERPPSPRRFNVETITRWWNEIDVNRVGKISRRDLLFALNGSPKLFNFFCAPQLLRCELEDERGSPDAADEDEEECRRSLVDDPTNPDGEGAAYRAAFQRKLLVLRRSLDVLDEISETVKRERSLRVRRESKVLNIRSRQFDFEKIMRYFKEQGMLLQYRVAVDRNYRDELQSLPLRKSEVTSEENVNNVDELDESGSENSILSSEERPDTPPESL